jgi:homoserine O-acetyltransferase
MSLSYRLQKLVLAAALSALPAAAALAAPVVAVSAPQQLVQLGDFTLENHSIIRDCAIGYRTVGTLNADKSNVVVFLPWHTGKSIEVLPLLTPKGLFNPAGYYVIVIDPIGNGVSCSPSNSVKQHGTSFPVFNMRDIVESQYQLLSEKLGFKHVHAFVGYSMGAATTYQWMVSHPTFMDVAVPVAGTPRQTSYDLLFWRTEEMAMLADPDYANGEYQKNPNLELFNRLFALNATSPAYRIANTKPEAIDKFLQETDEFDPESADANDSRWQIRAFMQQNIGDDAARKIKAKVHIINSRQDHMVNPGPALALAKQIKASTTILESNCGHSGLGCELDKMRPAIERALKQR